MQCYCLIRNDYSATYVGATKDLTHRLRQHNGEIKGGAKYTKKSLKQGYTWFIAFTVGEFPNWNETLKFEWKLKHISLKYKNQNPLLKRILSVVELLNSEKSTSTGELFNSFKNPLYITLYIQNKNTEKINNDTIKNQIILKNDELLKNN